MAGATLSTAGAPAVASSRSAPGSGEPPTSSRPVPRQKLAALTVVVVAGALALASHPGLADRLTAAFMAVVLVIVATTDVQRRIIPNRIVLPATVIVLFARILSSPGQSAAWVLAALGAGLVFLLPNLINRSAMGMGDVKLAAFLGVGLGTAVIGALLVAFVSSFPFAVATLWRGGQPARKATIPFGPFLAFGGLVILIIPRLVGLGGG
jgi:leader peptidase (prepilin peptidase) / N-methyltransferase